MSPKTFHRYHPGKGYPLYCLLLIYFVAGCFYPVIGSLVLICVIATVAFAARRGRWWCGNACPRGSIYDRVLAKYSPHRPIPKLVRTFGFRLFVVMFIFIMFTVRMCFAWGDWSAIGMGFWRIIIVTTIVGIVLSFIYAPRTWCSFCPMGALTSRVSPRSAPQPEGFVNIHVSDSCRMKCKSCARVCLMQLTPYDSRGYAAGHMDADCVKCGKCVTACPLKIMTLKNK